MLPAANPAQLRCALSLPLPLPSTFPTRGPPASSFPAGEWFEAKAEPGHGVEPLGEQRELVVGNLWKAVGIYAGVGVISTVAVCMHKVRGNL